MIIEQTVRSANCSLAIAFRVPSQAHPWLEVVLVGLDAFLQSKNVVATECEPSGRFKFRRNFHVIAQAVVQRQVGSDAPRVLPEHAEWNVLERVAGATQTLNVDCGKARAVSLHGRQVWKCGREL